MRRYSNARREYSPEVVERACQTMTIAELSSEFNVSITTIKKWVNDNGFKPQRLCHGCGVNRPREDFHSMSSQYCMRKHKTKVTRQAYVTDEQREWDKAMERQALASYWVATEEGQPNGPFERYAA